MFGAKQLFSYRDTDSVVALTPNIRLTLYFKNAATTSADPISAASSRPAQLGKTGPLGRLWKRNSNDRPNELTPKQYSPKIKHSTLPASIDLVELTGIEPVASWLQTRRSPS